MAKTKTEPVADAVLSAQFTIAADAVDPTLASLFASSSGPVKVQPRKATAAKSITSKPTTTGGNDQATSDDESEKEESSDPSDDERETAKVKMEEAERPRKRRRVANGDNVEEAYFQRLEREEEKEISKRKAEKGEENVETSDAEDGTSSSGSSDEDDDENDSDEVPAADDIPQHEALDKKISSDKEKLMRTVFLGNVSTEAIKDKRAKRTLLKHLRAALKPSEGGESVGKYESIRFRSTAYSSDSGPKKATFAKKELMDTTTKNTNAYAVFTTEEAAQHVARMLNGTVILDRHLRADYLGNPARIDNRRCVFVGNLSFVDEETVEEKTEGARPKAKQPADPEEGLWQTFNKVGRVESVRVVRDQETRVSKGFAYVQFEDVNSVEAALLLNEKKFPPLLPRKLRVMRSKRTKHAGNASAKLPRFGGAREKRSFGGRNAGTRGGAPGKPNNIVFEGHRASSNTSRTKADKLRKQKKKRPTNRSARRGAAFREGGKKKGAEKGDK